ncbi:MAG: leucine-rich repeat domain-containing protein, partial [Spirochaetaceae bacterium]|nr:leucine-rich repeat domain-containing protein [Spirochaetaceae bacterium]
DYAFSSCGRLTSIAIPASVKSIGTGAFEECNKLKSVTLSRRTQVANNAFPASAQIRYSD